MFAIALRFYVGNLYLKKMTHHILFSYRTCSRYSFR